MRIRERLCPNLLLRPSHAASDTDLWADTGLYLTPLTRITGRARLHLKPLAVLASGRLPPLTSDTHCRASHRFRHSQIKISFKPSPRLVKQKFNKTKIKLKSFDESPNHVMIILMVAVATVFLNVIGGNHVCRIIP